MTYSEKLAKRFAMGEVFCADYVNTEHYDLLMESEEDSQEEADLINEYNTWQHFEDMNNRDLIDLLCTEMEVSQSQIQQVQAAIKRGMVILAVGDKLPPDLNDLDMDDVAMVGENTIKVLDIDGDSYAFDMGSFKWVSDTSDVTYEMGDSGMPLK